MNQLDKDIKYLEFCLNCLKMTKHYESGFLNRLTDYLNELKMFRLRAMMNVETELNSVQAQMQLSKSELESYNRLQTIRQLQDQSQIVRQGDK